MTAPKKKTPVAEPGDGWFRWTSPTRGTVVTIASREVPTSGTWRRLRKMDDLNAMYELLEAVCTEEELAVTDELPPGEVQEAVMAWVKHVSDGVGLGESTGSST